MRPETVRSAFAYMLSTLLMIFTIMEHAMTEAEGLFGADFVEMFNKGCACISLDRELLNQELEKDLLDAGLARPLLETFPNLFASVPLFLSRRHVAQIQELISAVELASGTPAFRKAVSPWAPLIHGQEPLNKGVFFGYDFHMSADGPQLIEINTNAGGALLNGFLARAQRACCPPVEQQLVGVIDPHQIEERFHQMFLSEWRALRGETPLQRIAIVDEKPKDQGLYAEFVLFARFFEKRNIEALIVDPSELVFKEDALWVGSKKIDLVYNRLCDFYLQEPQHAAIAQAYAQGAAVVTPHPHAYARFADKRNLTVLSDASWHDLARLPTQTASLLKTGIPRTQLVTAANADDLWRDRKAWFFKPVTGFGSKAVYRGAKLTKRVWADIQKGGYVAQALVAPGERQIEDQNGEPVVLKADIRAYTYAGEIQLLVSRLYRGQTTNMKTPGGGFAPIFTESISEPLVITD